MKSKSTELAKKILEKAKKSIRPDSRIIKESDNFIHKLNKKLKQSKISAVCVKGGSVAKQTFLKNSHDVDIFVKFSRNYSGKELSSMLQEALPEKAERVHGSRDYFQLKKGKIIYEIVPVLDVKSPEQAENVTDMSPLHVGWVNSKTKKKPFLKDEIRLAKQFCKAIKVYGAESHIKGFSGHILDILIIHYGSFIKLLENASKWNHKVVIDASKSLKDPLKELNKDKLNSPLIIIDPVQPGRNAAAALSKKNFDQFVMCAKAFLESPKESFFKPKKLSIQEIKKIKKRMFPEEELITLQITPLKGKNDVVGSKVMKVYESVKKGLIENDFKIVFSDWEFGRPSIAYFFVKKEKLSSTIEIRGPPVSKKDNVNEFRKKHKKTRTVNNIVYAYEKRKYFSAISLIKALIKSDYVRERVERVLII